MPTPPTWVRAKLVLDDSSEIPCLFNPNEYTVSKANIWTYKPTSSRDMPDPDYGGGMPQIYKLSLLLDSTVKRPTPAPLTVPQAADKIMEAFHGKNSKPRFISFQWGSQQLPKAAPVSVSIRYALFEANGTPRRAFVDMELAQAEDNATVFKGQNPTTRSIPGLAVHKVLDGDSLPSIAYRHYGDPTHWRAIAEANDIADPMSLRRGTMLSVPRLTE